MEILRKVGWALSGGGSVEGSGIVQYARHGRGSLSGFNKWIKRRVIDSAKMEKKRRESSCSREFKSKKAHRNGKIRERRTIVEGCFGTKGCRRILRKTRTNDL